ASPKVIKATAFVLLMPAFDLLGHLIGFPIGAMSARDSRLAEQKLVAELRRIDGVHAQSHEVPRNRMKIGQRLSNSGGDRLPRDADRERTVWNPLTRHPIWFNLGADLVQALEHDQLKLDKISIDRRREK